MLALFFAPESVVHNGMTPPVQSGVGAWVRRLTPLAWLFVALAVLDLVQRLLWLPTPSTLTASLAGVIRATAPALLVLVPAAVLVGKPRAWRTSRLILIGALVVACAELLSLGWRMYWQPAVASAIAANERVPGEPVGDVIRLVVVIAQLAGPVLLGVGVSRLGANPSATSSLRPTIGGYLVIAFGAAVAGSQLLAVLGDQGPRHRLDVVAGVVAALVVVAWASLFAIALPRGSADRSARRGSLMLATGALAFVATGALSVVNTAVLNGAVAVPSGFFVLSSVLAGVGAVLLIAGFGAGVPHFDTPDIMAPGSSRTFVESPHTS